MHATTSSRRCRSPRWATRSRTSGSTSGTAWRSPPGSASTTSQIGFAGQPGVARRGADPRPGRIGATCAGVRVWSLYVPNGRDARRPALRLQAGMACRASRYGVGWLADDPAAPIALVGDWNIAPTDDGRLGHRAFEGSTHVTEPERAAFTRRRDAGSPTWCGRSPRAPGTTPTGTTRSCASPSAGHAHRLHPRLAGFGGARHARRDRARRTQARQEGHPAPSDHAPVLVDLS